MTRHVEPLCGFTWGYDLHDGVPEPTAIAVVGRDEWLDAREDLRAALPEWRLGGDNWQPSALPSSGEVDLSP
jgi:hypothetical protein